MGRYKHGHARLDQSAGNWQCCQRCGFIYSHADLHWQYEWAGTRLQNTGFQVCEKCLDEPSTILRTIIPGPDPVPIPNVVQMPFATYETNWLTTENGDILTTEDGVKLITENGGNADPEDFRVVSSSTQVSTDSRVISGGGFRILDE